MAEIRSKNSKNANSQTSNTQQQGNSAISVSPTTTTASLDNDDLQPLQVNVIDSDVEKLKEK